MSNEGKKRRIRTTPKEVENSFVGLRLKGLVAARGWSQTEFVQRIREAGGQITTASMSAWFAGTTEPSLIPCYYAARVLGIDLESLLDRDSEVVTPVSRVAARAEPATAAAPSPDEAAKFAAYREAMGVDVWVLLKLAGQLGAERAVESLLDARADQRTREAGQASQAGGATQPPRNRFYRDGI
ncbi:hypothetical protein EP7_002180 [Isosphaeraceae bacterium EP7]